MSSRVAALLVVVLSSCLGLGRAVAADPAHPARIDSAERYVKAFLRMYELPASEHDALATANAAMTRAQRWWLPHLSLRESLEGHDGGVNLDLSLSVRTLLFDATAVPELEAAIADVTLRAAVADGARTSGLAAFLQDVAAYALLAPAGDIAAAAVTDPGDAGTLPDPLSLPPARREAFEAALSALQGARWLASAVHDVQGRLALTLSVPVATLAPPAAANVEDLILMSIAPLVASSAPGAAQVGEAGLLESSVIGNNGVTANDAAVSRCLESAPAVRVAHARRDLTLSRARAAASPDVALELVAGADHELALTGGGQGSSPSATVGLEARFVLPDSWPVAGRVSAGVDLSGARQSAELSWPPDGSPVLYEPDAADVYAGEIAAATWEARSLLRAFEQAAADRGRLERQLAWAVRDAYPKVTTEKAKALATDPLSTAWGDVGVRGDHSLTRLRVETTLARLGALSAAINLAAHCATLPTASGD